MNFNEFLLFFMKTMQHLTKKMVKKIQLKKIFSYICVVKSNLKFRSFLGFL